MPLLPVSLSCSVTAPGRRAFLAGAIVTMLTAGGLVPCAAQAAESGGTGFPAAPDWQASAVWLMLVSAPGCHHCAAWRAQIAPGYAASDAGRVAPLFEVDLRGPYPDGLLLDRRPWITPSFILLHHGQERGRIEGYVGRNHFYPVLAALLAETGLSDTAGNGT